MHFTILQWVCGCWIFSQYINSRGSFNLIFLIPYLKCLEDSALCWWSRSSVSFFFSCVFLNWYHKTKLTCKFGWFLTIITIVQVSELHYRGIIKILIGFNSAGNFSFLSVMHLVHETVLVCPLSIAPWIQVAPWLFIVYRYLFYLVMIMISAMWSMSPNMGLWGR